jgi:hypothetical protein
MSDDLWSKAIRAHREGDFSTASTLYQQVLQMVKDEENEEDYCVVLDHLARLSIDNGDDHVGLRRYKTLLKMQETVGNNQEIAKISRQISKIYERKDEILEAIRWAERAFEASETVWNRQQMAFSYHLMGIMYQRANMEVKSVSSLRKSQGIWEELSDDFGLYNSTMVLADVYEDQSNISACIKELRKCLRFLSGDQDIEDIARLHFRISSLYLQIDDQRNALIHLLGSFGRNYRLRSPAIKKEAKLIQQIRITLGENPFWAIVAPRLRKEGENRLRKMLDEFFPPTTQEQFDVTDTGSDTATSKEEARQNTPPQKEVKQFVEVALPKPKDVSLVEKDSEFDTTPDEIASEEFSQTQEVDNKSEEESESLPSAVVVNYEESEDVDYTENSFFMEEEEYFDLSELTSSRMALAKDDVKREFLWHFLSSLGGVFLALMIAKYLLILL